MSQNTWVVSPWTMTDSNAIWTATWSNVSNAVTSNDTYATVDLTWAWSATQIGGTSRYQWESTVTKVSQSFYNSNIITLDSCSTPTYRTWSPTNIVAKLYAFAWTWGSSPGTWYPTGSVLATSDAVSVPTTSWAWGTPTIFPFTWANRIVLSANTPYCIVFEYTWDWSNYCWWKIANRYSTWEWNKALWTGSWDVWNGVEIFSCAVYWVLNTSHYLKATNFWFTIPNWSKINWIKVEIEWKSSWTNYAKESDIKIIKANWDVSTTNNSSNYFLTTSDTYKTYWSDTDLWWETWTPASINNSNFWLAYAVLWTWTSSIDHIRITIYYETVLNGANAYSSNNVYAQLTWAVSWVLWVSLSKDAWANFHNVIENTYTWTEWTQAYWWSSSVWWTTWTWDNVNDTNFRLKISHNWISQIYKNFWFSILNSNTITWIEISVEAKYVSADTSIYIDHIQVKVYYWTSLIPIVAWSQAYATNWRKNWEWAWAWTWVLTFYDWTNWKACDTWATVAA